MAQVTLRSGEAPALLWVEQLREGLYWDEVGGGGALLEASRVLTVCGKNGLIKIKGVPEESSREEWSESTRHAWSWFLEPFSLC